MRRLEQLDAPVRCLVRFPDRLRACGFRSELIQADLLDPASLAAAFDGVDIAFYLVHSMNDGPGFEAFERQCALNFAAAARAAGVKRIIYLGGLAQGAGLSSHMRSRAETGALLRSTGIPVIEFRASIVIGSGSASFEMIRALVERLPLMITPRWVHTDAQPIAIEDVIAYLIEAITIDLPHSMTGEIGGRDVTNYSGIMQEYARQRGLRRAILRVPFLSLSLSSSWLTLITPLYARIGRYLIDSVRHPSVVHDPVPAGRFQVRPMGVREAIGRAMSNETNQLPESRWSDASSGAAVERPVGNQSGATLRNEQTVRVPLPPDLAFDPIRRIGGRQGWYFGNSLWQIRGLVDLLMGGVGMRRGRPDPETPLVGNTLDFWRVEAYEPARRLRLFAEMKVPGQAWLEFRAEPYEDGTQLRQIAQFEPSGPIGWLYWYALWPVHEWMFRGMLRNIRAEAVRRSKAQARAVAAA